MVRTLALVPFAAHRAPAIVELIRGVFTEYALTFDLHGYEADLLDIHAHHVAAGGRFDVLLDGDRIIGSVAALPREPDVCEIKRVYLHRDYRGQGQGRALMEHVLGWAVAAGYRTAVAWSDTRFTDAHRMYRRLGFELFGEREIDDPDHSREYGFRRTIGR